VYPSIALSFSAKRSARGDFATFIGKFSHFLTPFYLILSLFRLLSPFTRPQPVAPGSMLATFQSGCGEDFAFASQLGQQVNIVMFEF